MAGIPWTDKEIKILKTLCKAGKTISDVQKVFPYRTKNSIDSKASLEGLSLAGLAPEPDMDAYARIIKGETKCL